MEGALFALFGIDAPSDGDLPAAAVTRVVDMNVIDGEWWLRADPVHLRPERDRLILLDAQLVPIGAEEAQALVAEPHADVRRRGLGAQGTASGPVVSPAAARAASRHHTLGDVVGRDIHAHLPRGEAGPAWRSLLNEMQILLHTARANESREARGELAINSVWFWGGGRLPAVPPASWARVHSSEPLALGLARLAGIPSAPVPARFADLRLGEGRTLVVLDGVRPAAQYREPRNWQEAIQRVERDWIAPVYEAVRAGALAEATLCADDSRLFRLSGRGARRWWRRRRPLEAYA